MNPFRSPSHKAIWAISWPMLLSNISQPLLGLVDSAILGHLNSADYLAAVALGTSILTLFYWSFGFLRMGTTGMIARSYGENNVPLMHKQLLQSGFMALIIAACIWLLSPLWLPWITQVMTPSDTLAPLSDSYVHIRLWASPATLLTYVLLGWLIALARTRAVLIIALVTNGANLVLDVWFILGLGMNSDGAALASVIAEYLGLSLALWLVFKPLKMSYYPLNDFFHWPDFRQLLQLNTHLFIRTLSLLAVTTYFTAQGAHISDEVLAANAILIKLVLLISLGLDSFAHAAESFAGQAIGAKQIRAFHKIYRDTMLWAGTAAVFLTLLLWFSQTVVIHAMTDIVVLREDLFQYWPWLCALPLISFISYQTDGIFIGADKTAAMRSVMLISMAGFFISWQYFQAWDNHGLWLSFIIFNTLRSSLMLAYSYYFSLKNQWGAN